MPQRWFSEGNLKCVALLQAHIKLILPVITYVHLSKTPGIAVVCQDKFWGCLALTTVMLA